MAKAYVKYTRARIARVELFLNVNAWTLEQVVANKKPDVAVEGTFYLSNWKAACHTKVNGEIVSNDSGYQAYGYAWDTGPDIDMFLIPGGEAAKKSNYLTCCQLVNLGKQFQTLYFNEDVAGVRGRGAVLLFQDAVGVYACTDGADGLDPYSLRDLCVSLGCRSAVMMDGGHKVNFYDRASGTMLKGGEKSQNYILIYLTEEKEKQPMSGRGHIVCLDPGHGPDTVNGSPDGTYKEKELAWDMYTRIRPLLEGQGIATVCTRTEDTKPSLTQRAQVSDNAGAELLVSLHSNAEGAAGLDADGWGTASGLMIYTSAGPETAARNVAAQAVAARMREAGIAVRKDAVLHQIEYTVLRAPKAPSILIEYGFHTNRGDTALLKDSAYRDKLAVATAKGVCDFLGVAWTDSGTGESTDTAGEKWGESSIQKAVSKGIVQGDENGTVNADEPVTLRQVCVLLDRLGQLDK